MPWSMGSFFPIRWWVYSETRVHDCPPTGLSRRLEVHFWFSSLVYKDLQYPELFHEFKSITHLNIRINITHLWDNFCIHYDLIYLLRVQRNSPFLCAGVLFNIWKVIISMPIIKTTMNFSNAWCLYTVLLSEHVYLLNIWSIIGAQRVGQCSHPSCKM